MALWIVSGPKSDICFGKRSAVLYVGNGLPRVDSRFVPKENPVSSVQPEHLRLNVLLRQEDECWVAFCPELNTLAADPDLEKAWEDVVRVCRARLAYGLAEGLSLDELVKPAPGNLAQIISQAETDGFLRLHMKGMGKTEVKVVRMFGCAA